MKPRDASPCANDYTTLKEFKANKREANTSSHMPSDRYETGSRRTGRSKQLKDLIEENKSMKVEDIETRSLHAELDYSKKDAVRHIVKSSGQ